MHLYTHIYIYAFKDICIDMQRSVFKTGNRQNVKQIGDFLFN